MFLFTSLPASDNAPAGTDAPVNTALHDAASRTGVSFDYLVRTAQRESNLDPNAKAPSSSASGLFQFLEQTWLGLVRSDGDKLGMGQASGAVVTGRDGRLTITDPGLKAKVLALRNNPEVAATAAGVFTAHNRETMTATLGRPPSDGELYIAHFLGAGGAGELVKLASIKPQAVAAGYFGEAAAANRPVFYTRSGRPKTAAEVYHGLIAAHETAGNQRRIEVASANPVANPAPIASDAGNERPFFGLFRSLPANSANGVQKAWAGLPRGSFPPGPAPESYYPRSAAPHEEVAAADAAGGTTPDASVKRADAAATPQRGLPADVPLPPVRPEIVARARPPRSVGVPLDLASFTRLKG